MSHTADQRLLRDILSQLKVLEATIQRMRASAEHKETDKYHAIVDNDGIVWGVQTGGSLVCGLCTHDGARRIADALNAKKEYQDGGGWDGDS